MASRFRVCRRLRWRSGRGDQVAACVAAASIVAKVTRDRLMAALGEEFPLYGFAEHKGYVTPQHRLALETHGPCPHHRYSFVTVARGMGENEMGGRGCLIRHAGGTGTTGGPR
ncbi:ribonuclease HII [Nonomuraea ferruginea]